MTVIAQDDHLPAGAWAAYALHGLIFLILETVAADRERGLFFLEAYFFPSNWDTQVALLPTVNIGGDIN